MKKIHMTRVIKFIALIVPTVLLVLFMQQYVFVFQDANTERIQRFYAEEKNSLDVVILGASEVTAGYSPGRAYQKYGYTSYMYAIDGNVGSLYNAQLNEILARQNPEVIVVEVFGFMQSEASLNSEVQLRIFVDNIPNSANKWNTILNHNYDNKFSCLIPFIKYHGDPVIAKSHLTYLRNTGSTLGSPSVLKGMVTQTTVHSGPGDDGIINDTNSRINDACEAYLREFLQYCQEKNLQNVVFVNFPRHIQDESHSDLLARVDHVQQIISEYGFDFLDFQKEQAAIGIDQQTDFYNSHHLNIYGQQKLTNYLGSTLMDRYHLTPRAQSPENQAQWQECAFFTEKYFTIVDELTAAGENDWFIADDMLLPYLDPENAERMQIALSK